VNEFRKLFLGLVGDVGNIKPYLEEFLGTEQVSNMLMSSRAFGDRAFHMVDSLVIKGLLDADCRGSMVCPHRKSQHKGTEEVDFPAFLCIMKKVADSSLMDSPKQKAKDSCFAG